ncbi:bifunctional UDP-N-acetylglucosamine diphosphorylase/glucosamine-1-phosphate N-acetyltransferase GlmU [Arsenicitalea aurantiaca]|uniref:Bifunctional protein GlmU n=1 Tax=Arsenicitalea aurantiaca TaxID=1783274 RepID=A0A433XFL8_9HYPH|nr:bifunctional UDP-N-acetylglucosamine diphosphorylase/glucosamine-1-phosphate N-acetyltransferase GlmU [Arsenicitalea aurantiaca]RUT32850.1 bifunctional UDP-N-acetylglucosamine diphosphorylase/glucosamine-1-phosphate N-acetyltransferase GlmU [Arsenicitalea aurantiaca]
MAELAAIVLAAGEGTRMRSSLPKVMHPIGGRPMLGHVLASATRAGAARLSVVIGPDHQGVAAMVAADYPGAAMVTQAERLGTAHAVRAARDLFSAGTGNVVVLFGDGPLVRHDTIAAVSARLEAGADIVVVGFDTPDPTGYGRLLTEGGRLRAIREHKDASEAERAVTLCNSGIMGFRAEALRAIIDRIGNANAKGEFYLTDAVELANADGREVAFTTAPADEVLGVNDRAQLAQAERQFQDLRRQDFMAAGVTLRDPATTWLSWDTEIARDVLIEPSVFIGPGVRIGEGAIIRAFSHLEGTTIGAGAEIGPFARLRPAAEIGDGAKIGNFVEVKKAEIAAGAKVNHLSYVGDASIGAKANLGAGTITCNYDGTNKHRTVIGAGAFIGSNSSLVAPVEIGEGAFVGSGSVITEDVPADALALGRARQVVKPGHAATLRERARALKAQKSGK